VLSDKNNKQFATNPLLMVDYEETEEIISKTGPNVSLLLDVAHLKVSSTSLGFSKESYVTDFRDITAAYHLSDNSGLEDSNEAIGPDSWFWPLIDRNLDYYSLEIYNASPDLLRQQLDIARKELNSAC
jgi:uncharacterized protein (UPF0276 family)